MPYLLLETYIWEYHNRTTWTALTTPTHIFQVAILCSRWFVVIGTAITQPPTWQSCPVMFRQEGVETPSFLVNDLVLRGTPRNKVHPKVTSSSSRPPYTSLSARQIQSLSTSSFHGDAEATKNGVEDRYAVQVAQYHGGSLSSFSIYCAIITSLFCFLLSIKPSFSRNCKMNASICSLGNSLTFSLSRDPSGASLCLTD